MKLYFRYISFLYLKYFFIIFFALEFFYVAVDTLLNMKNLPESANLAFLYVILTALMAVSYMLPLSLVFALIITKFNIIRSNELVSFYSLGISKNALIMPAFSMSLIITFFYVFLNFTSFAYAADFQDSLEDSGTLAQNSKNIFLKYGDSFIYIEDLNPLAKVANNIKVYSLSSKNKFTYSAKQAIYKGGSWELKDVEKLSFPKEIQLGGQGLQKDKLAKVIALKNFKPSSIANINKSSGLYTIPDAINSIKIFKKQGINISTIKSSLYVMLFFPFFAPFMVMILYYYLPITGRFFNLALASFAFFIVTLCAWGICFVLIRFAMTDTIIPELAIMLPILILASFAARLYIKNA